MLFHVVSCCFLYIYIYTSSINCVSTSMAFSLSYWGHLSNRHSEGWSSVCCAGCISVAFGRAMRPSKCEAVRPKRSKKAWFGSHDLWRWPGVMAEQAVLWSRFSLHLKGIFFWARHEKSVKKGYSCVQWASESDPLFLPRELQHLWGSIEWYVKSADCSISGGLVMCGRAISRITYMIYTLFLACCFFQEWYYNIL